MQGPSGPRRTVLFVRVFFIIRPTTKARDIIAQIGDRSKVSKGMRFPSIIWRVHKWELAAFPGCECCMRSQNPIERWQLYGRLTSWMGQGTAIVEIYPSFFYRKAGARRP